MTILTKVTYFAIEILICIFMLSNNGKHFLKTISYLHVFIWEMSLQIIWIIWDLSLSFSLTVFEFFIYTFLILVICQVNSWQILHIIWAFSASWDIWEFFITIELRKQVYQVGYEKISILSSKLVQVSNFSK